jgi:hypothetical protein
MAIRATHASCLSANETETAPPARGSLFFEEPRAMGVGGAPRAVGGRVAGSPLREAEGIHPAIGHYARSCASADSEFGFD